MNKNDIKLIIGIGFVTLILFLAISMVHQPDAKMAVVYYQNEIVKTIDLFKNEQKEYVVEGKNGPVVIEVNQGKIRVKKEDSPLHICSKQGYIHKSTETIVCLPNQIVIQIEEQNKFDTIVR